MKYAIAKRYKCIDAHNHVWGRNGRLDTAEAENVLKAADLVGIDRICVSVPLTHDCPTPEEVRRNNDIAIEAMKFSKRFLGFCFVNPGYAREATAEIERCVVEHGMVGVKLYHQYFISDPAQRPVMEKAAELGIPVLMHAGKVTDPMTRAAQPRLSAAEHFLQALKMFPDTMLIQGHIGGGGDWEWNLRGLESISGNNYYIDLSGSVVDAGIARRTLDTVGEDRVLFATDMSYEEGVGKVIDAGFSERQLVKIFSGNMEKILARRKK
ncbi:MAG: amidohydrolase [Verrucomicrobia bacterium]|nr:amidohydrolase [Verrucomicrobiota bacterium]